LRILRNKSKGKFNCARLKQKAGGRYTIQEQNQEPARRRRY